MSGTVKLIEIREDERDIAKVAENAQILLEEEHNIVISSAKVIPTIFYAYLKEAMKLIASKKQAGETVTLNLMQLLAIGVEDEGAEEDKEKDSNFVPVVRAGQEFKLLVKGDTEDAE